MKTVTPALGEPVIFTSTFGNSRSERRLPCLGTGQPDYNWLPGACRTVNVGVLRSASCRPLDEMVADL